MPTMVALWDLDRKATESFASDTTPPPADWKMRDINVGEAVIGTDERTLVKPKDYAPNGKYRCEPRFSCHSLKLLMNVEAIVKLFGRMEGQAPGAPWLMATGWLIRPNLIVTAGHVACDWDHSLGLLKELKCYIGYHGRGRTRESTVQFRRVCHRRLVRSRSSQCCTSLSLSDRVTYPGC